MTNTAIKIQNVSKRYKDFYAVKEANISIEKGKIYGLVGKNGAGKTTLFKMILGLSNPTQGSISINGSTTQSGLLKERENIGFYIGPTFFENLSAKQNLEYYRILKNIKDKNEVMRVLNIVGLGNEKKKFKAYSMGMKQRLGIANSLLGNPEIIILDEPINGLDPQGILEIRQLIKSLNHDFGKTLIVSSHILTELDLVADTFGIIDHGIFLKQIEKENFKDQTSIELYTSDDLKTQEILFNKFKIEIHKNLIKDMKQIDNKVLSELINQNLEIKQIINTKKTLENYYFELTETGEKYDSTN